MEILPCDHGQATSTALPHVPSVKAVSHGSLPHLTGSDYEIRLQKCKSWKVKMLFKDALWRWGSQGRSQHFSSLYPLIRAGAGYGVTAPKVTQLRPRLQRVFSCKGSCQVTQGLSREMDALRDSFTME